MLIGSRLGHYVVLEELGRGGMGVVYAAEDKKLDRRVALKLLRADVGESPDRRARFQREAKAAAALNHPNIVHLYSVDEAGGNLFITMELVQGASLRELLNGGVPLPLLKTLNIAGQLAEGLACAHAAGILHRDLKPANIMIAEGDRVKILDFGLARLVAPGSGPHGETISDAETRADASSSAGLALGTVGYMSPEQALGRPVDARTDLFALGVVLFEMATGKAPFAGATVAAVFDQLLNRSPLAPQSLNAALPSSLAAIIDKALEKDPERRYASAQELLQDLRAVDPSANRRASPVNSVSAPFGTRMASSIVVLPFVDMSAEQDQEYFCHGVAEEIINSLTRVSNLRVISRTSAFAFQGQPLDVTEIGRRLKVGTVLEGSVRKAGDRVRVSAQLVETRNGYQLWSRRFDRDRSDVFAIQDEIAATIVEELRREMAGNTAPPDTHPARLPASRRGPLDFLSHDAYLRGMYALNKWTDRSMEHAIADFRTAILHDPEFAPAYTALAEAYIWLYSGIGVVAARDSVPQARWAVHRALELDPTLADAYRSRALIAMNHDWNPRAAAEAISRALELAPGSASTHLWNAWRLSLLERRHAESLHELEEAERLDPLDLQLKTQIGYVHHFRHDHDRATQQFNRVVALEPSFAFAHYALGDACAERGEYDRAIAEYHTAIELGGRTANHVGALGYAHGRAGQRDRARELLQELEERAASSHVSPMWIGLIHLGLSDLAGLFSCLDRAFEERDGSLVLVTAAVEFDPVREDPRFKSLLERMGLGRLAALPA